MERVSGSPVQHERVPGSQQQAMKQPQTVCWCQWSWSQWLSEWKVQTPRTLSTKSSRDKVLNMYERSPWHQQEISQTLAENKSLWKNKHVMLLGLKTLSLKVPKQSQRVERTKYWKGNLLRRAEDLEVEKGLWPDLEQWQGHPNWDKGRDQWIGPCDALLSRVAKEANNEIHVWLFF